ncbi:MAG: CBS domain-containing protein [Planctomycetes bacterium]|nr:CBS domain-containing protein [Planctomycetota bacterium]
MTVDLHRLRAKDVMSKAPQWATAHENLLTAARRMVQHGIRALLVAGADPTDLPGIVTSKDIVNLLGTQDPAVLSELRVADVMTRPAICVPATTNLLDCINLMRMAGVRRMPVVDGTAVVGLLSTSDIFQRTMAEA